MEAVSEMCSELLKRIPADASRICLVGGGGKTTILMRLAEAYVQRGRRVILTTTTHMFRPGTEMADRERQYPEGMPYIIPNSPEELPEEAMVREFLDRRGLLFIAASDPEKPYKVRAMSEHVLDELQKLCDILLIEADGSARQPIKIPRSWEPVVPMNTDVTIAVVGLSALKHSIKECSYVPEAMAEFLGKHTDDPVTEKDLIRILRGKGGLRTRTYGKYVVVLNQADTVELRRKAAGILSELAKDGIEGAAFTRRDRLAVILLGAGLSRRFGGEKMLAELPDGQPMILAAMTKAEQIAADQYILVTKDPELQRRLNGRVIPQLSAHGRRYWQAVLNPHPEKGISSSMKCGLREAVSADGWLFMVCDQPRLETATAERMIRTWRTGAGDIISASWQGRPGNPKLFSSAFGDELQRLEGDIGGRQIIKRHAESLQLVEVRYPEELMDIDTRKDWEDITACEVVSKKDEKKC